MNNQSEFKVFGEDLPTEKCLLEVLPLSDDDEPVQALFDPETKTVFWKGQAHEPFKYRVLTTQHILTEQDFANNPEFVSHGLKVGDEIGLPIYPDAVNQELAEQFAVPETEDGAGSVEQTPANFEKVDTLSQKPEMKLPDVDAGQLTDANVRKPEFEQGDPMPELATTDAKVLEGTEPAANKTEGSEEQPV